MTVVSYNNAYLMMVGNCPGPSTATLRRTKMVRSRASCRSVHHTGIAMGALLFPSESIYILRSEICECQLPHIYQRKSRTFAVVGSWRNAPAISMEQRLMEPELWELHTVPHDGIVPSQRSCQPRQRENPSCLLIMSVVVDGLRLLKPD
jgi:hypothetical protein